MYYLVLHSINSEPMSSSMLSISKWRGYVISFMIVTSFICTNATPEPQKTYRHYPEEIHKLVRQKLDKLYGRQRNRTPGTWSDWGQWSTCSRTCGTGVATQHRECIARTRHRKQKDSRCVGKSKRFQLCNTQVCRGSRLDFRSEQCRSYNNKVFNKQIYSWEPYLDGGDSCTLNCKPIGLSFYATLNQSVIDGTPCSSTNSRRICVEGRCMEVGCDGILGSGKVFDACGVCGGLGETCRAISRVFVERHLSYGYNLVTTLPPRAENISIYHIRPSNNYLAVRDTGGTFVISPSRNRGPHGRFRAGGVIFTYTGGTSSRGDRLTAYGPLRNSVDVMLFHKEKNLGIKYEYTMPKASYEFARQSPVGHSRFSSPIKHPLLMLSDGPRGKSDTISGKKFKDDPTSKNRSSKWTFDPSEFVHPYGRALQSNALQEPWERAKTNFVVREEEAANGAGRPDAFSNSFIAGAEKDATTSREHHKSPKTKNLKSNKKKRKSKRKHHKSKHKYTWITNGYSACSQTCGTGTQVTRTTCVRAKNHNVHVPVELCADVLPPSQKSRKCNVQPCPASWHADEWGPCSVSCGLGIQLRNITCKRNLFPGNEITVADEECTEAPLESSAKVCKLKECDGTAEWETEQWGACSVDCGIGIRKRKVFCSTAYGHVSYRKCPGQKPFSEEMCDMGSCSSNTWFFSEWENLCSGPCGGGVYKRKVLCSGDASSNDSCTQSNKPPSTKPCLSSDTRGLCEGKWFTSPWSECDAASCEDIGYQQREVVCVTWKPHKYKVINDEACLGGASKPADMKSCNVTCKSKWVMSEWSQCSVPCGGGVQRREMKCLNADLYGECSRDHRPDSRQRCNLQPCWQDNEVPNQNKDIQNDIQDLPAQLTNPMYNQSDCLDRMKNCKLVLKARLCKLQYYSKLCCQTCRNE